MREATKPKRFYGYTAVVFLVLMMFCIYSVFAVFTNMMTDIMTRLSIDATQLGMAITVRSLAGLAVSVVSYKIYPYIKPNMCMIISAIGMVIMVASFLYGPLWSIYVTSFLYGFCMGTGMQVGMPVYVSQWFVDRRDEMVGYGFAAVNGGTAIASIIFGVLSAAFDNATAAIIMVALFGALSVVASVFLRNPESMGQKPLGFEKISAAEADATDEENLPGLSAVQTRKTAAFWLLAIGLFIAGASFTGASYTTVIVGSLGFDATVTSFIYATFTGCSALAMMIYGNIASRLGVKPFMIIGAACMVAFSVLYAYATVSGWTNPVIYAVICGGIGFGTAGVGLIPSLVTPVIFGERSISGSTPMLQNVMATGNGLSVSILTIPVATTGAWTLTLAGCAACALVGWALVFVSCRMAPIKKWREEHPNFAQEVAARIAAQGGRQ